MKLEKILYFIIFSLATQFNAAGSLSCRVQQPFEIQELGNDNLNFSLQVVLSPN